MVKLVVGFIKIIELNQINFVVNYKTIVISIDFEQQRRSYY